MSEKRVTVWVQAFKDRPALMLQWIDPETGQRKSKSAGADNPEDAEQARADLEYELAHGKYQEVSKLDWDRFRHAFEEEYAAGLRRSSQEKLKAVLDVFEQIVKPNRLKSVTERTISLFVKGMRERKQPNGKIGLASITMKNYLICLKTALSWAVQQKLLSEVPKFPKIKVPKKKPQPIDPTDFEKMLANAPDDYWRAYLLCGWWGGLRLSEARYLQWKASDALPWVDFPNNRIVLPATFSKNSEDQWVPMPTALRDALEKLSMDRPGVFPFVSHYTGERLSRHGITSRIRDIATRAGVKLSMHKLRKGFGCRVAKQLGKGNAPILHRLMRHSSMQLTMDYYASVDDALQEAIKGLT